MAKPIVTPNKPAPISAPPIARLSWPTTPKELALEARTFRILRLNAFEWQAYVTEAGRETPIGKPDLFDLVSRKVAGILRAEGQLEFLEKKQKAELETQARNLAAAQAKAHAKQ